MNSSLSSFHWWWSFPISSQISWIICVGPIGLVSSSAIIISPTSSSTFVNHCLKLLKTINWMETRWAKKSKDHEIAKKRAHEDHTKEHEKGMRKQAKQKRSRCTKKSITREQKRRWMSHHQIYELSQVRDNSPKWGQRGINYHFLYILSLLLNNRISFICEKR